MLGCIILLSSVGGVAQAQSRAVIAVRDRATDQPLPNAEVLLNGAPTGGLTNAAGEYRATWRAGTTLKLRVRQIGFAPLDTTLTDLPADNRVVLRLARVAYQLPEVVAAAVEGCPAPPSGEAAQRTALILEQLQIGASHVEAFQRQYSWRVQQTRLSWSPTSTQKNLGLRRYSERVSSKKWGEPYRQGKVFEEDRQGVFYVQVPFVTALASPEFIAAHCFTALPAFAGDSVPMLRLAFAPKASVTTPDWSGIAMLDSATAELRRVEYRLSGLTADIKLARFDGITEFVRVSPYVMMPRQSAALWWYKAPAPGEPWPTPGFAQKLITRELQWRGDQPPGTDKVTVVVPDSLPIWKAEIREPSSR